VSAKTNLLDMPTDPPRRLSLRKSVQRSPLALYYCTHSRLTNHLSSELIGRYLARRHLHVLVHDTREIAL